MKGALYEMVGYDLEFLNSKLCKDSVSFKMSRYLDSA